MKLKTLITTLVLGATTAGSVAVAQPAWGSPYDRHDRPGDYDRDHRGWSGWVPPNYPVYNNGGYNNGGYNNGYRHRRFARAWQPLPVYKTNFGAVEQEHWIGGGAGRFHALRLDATGPMFVSAVMIQFANLDKQIVQVNRWISPRDADGLVIDLQGGRRGIERVIVYTPNGRANYQLSAL